MSVMKDDNSLVVSNTPVVSIIIPVYGAIEFTLLCIKSIVKHQSTLPIEVIVVDDFSPDSSVEVLGEIDGIHLICNKTNQGFIRSCNTGARSAKGQYLYFLNNDTEVTSGWLDALYRTFSEFPGTGLVGSRLVYPDGRLQEAGGIIWRDGSAWNFGKFQDASHPVYSYAREVDYCSGASIMVPSVLFNELGGFDENYLPAYCEDSDLALKIRNKGFRVIYQPLSTVIHYEGITSGVDTSKGIKAFQIQNSKKLFDKWESHLRSHQLPGVDVDSAKDRAALRRVLVIDSCTPTPNQDAGSVTTFNLMLLLRDMGFQVTFIPEHNLLYMPDYTPALQRTGVEVLYSPYIFTVEQHLREYGDRYSLVFLFRPNVVEAHIRNIRRYCPGAKVLYHTIDLHYLRQSREAELQDDNTKKSIANEVKLRELAGIRSVDATILHSTSELDFIRHLLPESQLHVFPLILDIKGTSKKYSERKDIVYVGGYNHLPNVDAVLYFVENIMPLVRLKLPGIRFYVVGSNPPLEVRQLATEDIKVTGFVNDLASMLDKMRISVVPLRYGAGIKGKIGTAMSAGLPVVATSMAAEGMSLDGDEIIVADEPQAFVEAIVRVYNDEILWGKLSQNGLKFSENKWGAEAAWKILSGILGKLELNTSRGSRPLVLYSHEREYISDIRESQANQYESLDNPLGPGLHEADIRHDLHPLFIARSRTEYFAGMQDEIFNSIKLVEESLTEKAGEGYLTCMCIPCDKEVSLHFDMQSGGRKDGNRYYPNWREVLVCPVCNMCNRQRLVAGIVRRHIVEHRINRIFFMEQVTPIYHWAINAFPHHQIIGSEYLGHDHAGGQVTNGIRHEDITGLSFEDDSLDLIVSNDVFEHVPEPGKAFAECYRVLKNGGTMLLTIPFHSNDEKSKTRAKLVDGQLVHILAPEYHGNPVSADGSLVFTDFGWDVIQEIQSAGFTDAYIEVYASVTFGHLGNGQLIFKLMK